MFTYWQGFLNMAFLYGPGSPSMVEIKLLLEAYQAALEPESGRSVLEELMGRRQAMTSLKVSPKLFGVLMVLQGDKEE